MGLDFLSHPFWDKYIEFEERLECEDKIFAILERVVHIPMHQYARYFDRFRTLAQSRPLTELLPEDTLAQFRQEVMADPPPAVQAGQQQIKMERGELEIEREIRTRIDSFHLEIFSRTQTETTKRWTYESEIKRPYFHVTELDEPQLVNWRKYLDFEEVESGFERVAFLYERCLVTCAFYDEFWYRYVRWMYAQEGKEEDARNIYQRASMIFVPISRPGIRLQYAAFEESQSGSDMARSVYESILELCKPSPPPLPYSPSKKIMLILQYPVTLKPSSRGQTLNDAKADWMLPLESTGPILRAKSVISTRKAHSRPNGRGYYGRSRVVRTKPDKFIRRIISGISIADISGSTGSSSRWISPLAPKRNPPITSGYARLWTTSARRATCLPASSKIWPITIWSTC